MNFSPDQEPYTPNDHGNGEGGRKTRRSGTRGATRCMVTCAILCALSVVTLAIGTVLEIIDLTAAAMAAVVILLIYLCYGARYALLSYAVTGVLGAVLMPQSLAVWSYVGLMGYYPVVKRRLDRLPRILGWIVKLLLFAAVMGVCLVGFYFLLYGGEGSLGDTFLRLFGEEESGTPLMAWALLGLSLFTYIVFDLLLDRLLILYELRFRRKVEKWMKRK